MKNKITKKKKLIKKWNIFLKLLLYLNVLLLFQSCNNVSNIIDSTPLCDDEDGLKTVKYLLLKLYCNHNWWNCFTNEYTESLIGVKLKYIKEISYNATNKERVCEGYGIIVKADRFTDNNFTKESFSGMKGEFTYKIKEVINLEERNKKKDWIVKVSSFFNSWHYLKEDELRFIFEDLEKNLELFELPDLIPYNPARGVKPDDYDKYLKKENLKAENNTSNNSISKNNPDNSSFKIKPQRKEKIHKVSPREKILEEIKNENLRE